MTDQTPVISVPYAISKRGGRKLILSPDGAPACPPARSRPENALLKALARGFCWQKMLREGDYHTLEEIAEAENINPSYVSQLLRMMLLAPEIVEAILAGRQPPGLTMARAMQPFLVEWRCPSFLSLSLPPCEACNTARPSLLREGTTHPTSKKGAT